MTARGTRATPPTIIDVAHHAGVSKSTVSNVLQARSSVAEPLRQRVMASVQALNYRPHVGARSLRQQAQVLGVVVGDLNNPFHAELAARLENEAAHREHSMLLATTGGVGDREAARIQALLGHRVAALIFLDAPHRNGRRLLDGSTPVVMASVASSTFPSIAVDEAAGTRAAVEHLIGLGHNRIGFVSAMLGDGASTERPRFKGFEQAMTAAGLTIVAPWLLRPSRLKTDDASWFEVFRRYARQVDRPTAVVAAHDLMALELLAAAEAEGLRIPEDLSIVGFDDIAVARWSRVSLTTIAQPMDDIAKGAVEMAIEAASGTRSVQRRRISLQPRLVVRGTSAPPKVERN